MKTVKKRKKRLSGKNKKTDNYSFRMAIISSRGQVTIPRDIRDLMHVGEGSVLGFEPAKRGVIMMPMNVEPKDPYTEEEWKRIEKLSKNKGKTYDNADEAKKHIADL